MKTLAAIPCHDEGLAIGSVVLKARKYVDEFEMVLERPDKVGN